MVVDEKPMIPIQRVNLDDYSYVVGEVFADVLGDDIGIIIDRLNKGELSFWNAPPPLDDSYYGFLIIGKYTDEKTGFRNLVIHAAKGKGLYNPDGMETLYELGRVEQCENIICRVSRPGLERLLSRIGFRLMLRDGETVMIKDIPHGKE